MRKYFITIVVFLVIPAAVYAFSFTDVLSFGKNFFKKDKAPQGTAAEATSTRPFFPELADKKAENWKNAYKQRDISRVFLDSYNFVFYEGEANYLLSKELGAMSKPPARDVEVKITKDLITISGQSLLKYLPGKFSLEGKIVAGEKRIYAKITKARYRGIYFPAALAQKIIRDETRDMMDFLYSSGDYDHLEVEVGDGYLKMVYSK